VQAQPVDDLVDDLALGAECDSDEIEILRRNSGDSGAVWLVVVRREELARVDGPRDATAQRTL
jgi:hypothetical protein